jgi:U3 small nucleolar RNA-associated protein 12
MWFILGCRVLFFRFRCLDALLFLDGNTHFYALLLQEGTLDIVDINASERVESVEAHSGPVWSVAALSDGSGFVSGSADHDVKFWEWQLVAGEDGVRRLGIVHVRTLKMADDVLCVRISPNGALWLPFHTAP